MHPLCIDHRGLASAFNHRVGDGVIKVIAPGREVVKAVPERRIADERRNGFYVIAGMDADQRERIKQGIMRLRAHLDQR